MSQIRSQHQALVVASGNFYPSRNTQYFDAKLIIDTRTKQYHLIENTNDQNAFPPRPFLSGSIDELTFEDELPGTPREVIFSSGERLNALTHTELSQWLASQNHTSSLFAKYESKLRYTFLGLLIVPIFLWACLTKVIPAATVAFVESLPQSATQLGNGNVLAILDETVLDATSLSLAEQEQFKALLQDTLIHLSQSGAYSPNTRITLYFRSSESLGANAFALADGSIVITDQLVEVTNSDVNLIRAILLHEIGHVVHRHVLKMTAESFATSLFLTFLLGDLEGSAELVIGFSNTIIQAQFSQSLEWEADEFAIKQLNEMGLESAALGDALEKLMGAHPEHNATSRFDKYLQSHPLSSERIAHARGSKPPEKGQSSN